MYTPTQAIEAIQAILKGEYDNPILANLKPLLPDKLNNVKRIVAKTNIDPVVKVLFLQEVFPDNILAVFPDQVENNQPVPTITCYSNSGQHTTTSKGYARMLKEASLKKYKHLLTELNQQGYNLQVLNKTGYKL